MKLPAFFLVCAFSFCQGCTQDFFFKQENSVEKAERIKDTADMCLHYAKDGFFAEKPLLNVKNGKHCPYSEDSLIQLLSSGHRKKRLVAVSFSSDFERCTETELREKISALEALLSPYANHVVFLLESRYSYIRILKE